MKGLDTSKWQRSKVDYAEAKKAGYSFVFLRIGYNNTKDKCFEQDYASAIKAGLRVGVYFYTRSTTVTQAVNDATRVLGWLNNRHLDLPVVYDIEDAKQKGTNRKAINTAMYNAFADKIKKHYPCMLYTGEYFFNNYFNKGGITDPLWIAKYSKDQPSVGREVSIWQHSSSADKTDFYKSDLDRNWMLVDKWQKNVKSYSRDAIVGVATAWIGHNESDGTHKQIIDVYNSHTPLARGYQVKYTDSWCATFVSAVAIKAEYTDIIPTECSCQRMIDLFKAKGDWVELDSYIPKRGDIIFYDWDDNGVGDNSGWSDHVGIVASVSDDLIVVIEGNYNNSVKCRHIAVNAKDIRGYGVPRYTDANPYPVPTRTLKRTYPTMSGNDVKWLQWELCQNGYLTEDDIDGKFGNKTLNAVKAYQKAHGLKVDGKVGPATRYSLLND